MSQTLTVALGERSYPIHIGPGLLDSPDAFRPHLGRGGVMIVTNETVAPLYLERTRAALAASRAGLRVGTAVLPDGEIHKTWEVLNRIFDALIEGRFARDCTLVALGGGVIGDMAGFAAACWQRGVPFIQVPTTLLAQVDSSVGGKTGINHPAAKNMIGAFHQPRAVIADTETLDTLPDRELAAGLGEVIKYGLIRDPAFFDWIESNLEALLGRDPQALAYAIRRSCENKAEVVAADELESGQRALLNLGHSFGHAIESGAGYGTWLHGEAVGAGICMAADLSARLGWLDVAALARIRRAVAAARLPVAPPPGLGADRFLELMAVDKKVLEGRLRLVLLRSIGEALVSDAFDPAMLRLTLEGAPIGG